jgi:hypothetical protein
MSDVWLAGWTVVLVAGAELVALLAPTAAP